MGYTKSSSKREVYSTGLYQEIRKNLNKQPNLPSKGIRKTNTKSKVSKRKGIVRLKQK